MRRRPIGYVGHINLPMHQANLLESLLFLLLVFVFVYFSLANVLGPGECGHPFVVIIVRFDDLKVSGVGLITGKSAPPFRNIWIHHCFPLS